MLRRFDCGAESRMEESAAIDQDQTNAAATQQRPVWRAVYAVTAQDFTREFEVLPGEVA